MYNSAEKTKMILSVLLNSERMGNNMKKKFVTFILSALLFTSFVTACSKEPASTTQDTAAVTTPDAVTTSSEAQTTTAVSLTTIAPVPAFPEIPITREEENYVSPDLSTVDFDTDKESTKAYSNPIRASHGDPFVMRYDGSYYLYYSVGDGSPIYVHKSNDLVNWSEKMICVPTDEIPGGTNEHGGVNETALGAYAPEVV